MNCATRRRGQASAETLVVFLIFLTIFGIVSASVFRAGSAADERLSYELSKKGFSELSGKISEACALGNGNVRLLDFPGGNAAISSSGKTRAIL